MSFFRSTGLVANAAAVPRVRRWRLPSQCAVCHQWGGERVCGDCLTRFAQAVPRCARCALDVPSGVAVCGACLVDPPPFERSLAALDYAFPWSGLITRFKFHDGLDLAPMFVQRMLAVYSADRAAHPDAPAPTWLLPVPLSAERIRERGYNQAWELARRLASVLRCAADARLLLRVKDTPHQLALPVEQRPANVRGAFAVEPRRRDELRGRVVAVVDDVVTSGATVAEISRVLLQAGAAQVHVWSLARTPRPEER